MEANTLSLFNFNGHDVRVVMIDGAPWWVAVDVCLVLGLPLHLPRALLAEACARLGVDAK